MNRSKVPLFFRVFPVAAALLLGATSCDGGATVSPSVVVQQAAPQNPNTSTQGTDTGVDTTTEQAGIQPVATTQHDQSLAVTISTDPPMVAEQQPPQPMGSNPTPADITDLILVTGQKQPNTPTQRAHV